MLQEHQTAEFVGCDNGFWWRGKLTRGAWRGAGRGMCPSESKQQSRSHAVTHSRVEDEESWQSKEGRSLTQILC